MIRERMYLSKVKKVIKVIGFTWCIVLILLTTSKDAKAVSTDTGTKTYTITFDPRGGTVTAGATSVTFGGTYGNLPKATRKNYEFEGWYTFASGGVKITQDSTVKLSSSHILYAHWKGKECNITLNVNGGVLAEESLTICYGSKYQQLPTPTKENYTFTGWYTSLTGGDKIISNSIFDDNSKKTLYARWTDKNIKITFYALNNEDVYYIEAGCGKKIGKLPEPKREGYVFAGWYFRDDYQNLNADSVTSDYTVTAGTPRKVFARWRIAGT